jgi:hypothetical protein
VSVFPVCSLCKVLEVLTLEMLSLLTSDVLMTLLICASTITGSPVQSRSPYGVKERHHVPRAWSRVGRAPADHLVQLHIGLKQSQFSELERQLYEGNALA